jgi:hypothetical protein
MCVYTYQGAGGNAGGKRRRGAGAPRQYLYFCTSKASKVGAGGNAGGKRRRSASAPRQYLYFCTSTASKLVKGGAVQVRRVSTCTFALVKQVNRFSTRCSMRRRTQRNRTSICTFVLVLLY